MTLNKDPESWARVKPDAFLTGSIVQARNVIEMALQDIAALAAEIRRLGGNPKQDRGVDIIDRKSTQIGQVTVTTTFGRIR